jgi:hypothetical protein
MAGDIYLKLGEKWNIRPFINIPRAEARHQEMLRELARRAATEQDGALIAGQYHTAAVQVRYDSLLARGQTSLLEALRVGALVEEQDIADLRALAATTDNPDLKSVIAALERGSRHHLRAFVQNLRSRRAEYTPQALPAEAVAEIISPRN